MSKWRVRKNYDIWQVLDAAGNSVGLYLTFDRAILFADYNARINGSRTGMTVDPFWLQEHP